MSSYASFCERLFRQNEFSVKLGVDRLRRALDCEGAPDDDYLSLHVAGTNGKGSVASFCHAGLVGAGYRVGLFTSPHLVEVRERIRVDGVPVSARQFLEIGSYVLDEWSDSRSREERLTYFEILTLIAALHFQRQRVDVVVFEVGLGGRLDATNAVDTDLAVITPVALDHTRHLGSDVESVFAEKAGVLRPDTPAVLCRPEGWSISKVRDAVAATGVGPLCIEGEGFRLSNDTATVMGEDVGLDWVAMIGKHQKRNAACALAALDLWRRQISPRVPPVTALLPDLARARWPGRWQSVQWNGATVIVDGAHNPHAAKVAAATIREQWPGRVTLLFAVSKNKDLEAIFQALAPVVAELICVPVQNPRVEEPAHNAAVAFQCGIRSRVAPSLPAGLEWARETNRPIVALGSLYLVGEILRAVGHTAETLPVLEQPVCQSHQSLHAR